MNKQNKTLPLVALSMIGCASALFGVDDMQVRNLENRVNALEQRRGANGMINPPARPVVKNGVDIWVQAEALIMHATEDGLHYGVKNENGASFDGRVKNVSYDWSWGWRTGLGYNLPHDGWDMLLNYSWFRAGDGSTSDIDGSEEMFQTWTIPTQAVSNSVAAKARGSSILKFRYLDFQMGREFFVSKWLTLRPYLGARGNWTHRTLKVKYRTPNSFRLKEKFKNRFRGGGLLAGLDTQWGLGMGWSIYGQGAFSLLYGTQRLHETQDRRNVGRLAVVRDAWTTLRTQADLGAGIRWDRLFYEDAYRIRLQFGWEEHILSGFDRDINLVNQSSTNGKFAWNEGDLGVSGFAFQARFDF